MAKKTNPLISIIVPIYNVEKYLPACLKSIANQSYQNLEVILIDDGSTDGSAQIAKDFTKTDPRFKYYHQSNQGQSSARNYGLELSTGGFISFVDADDEIKPNFIKKLLSAFTDTASFTACGIHRRHIKTNNTENIYTNSVHSRRNHESFKAYILRLLVTDGRLYPSVNKLYRAELAKQCSFDANLKFAEDTKFVLDYLKKIPSNPIFILAPLYIYNFGTETSTMRATSTNWENWQISYQNLKRWLDPHPTIKEKIWLRLVHLRWHISYHRSLRRAKQ